MCELSSIHYVATRIQFLLWGDTGETMDEKGSGPAREGSKGRK